MRRLLIFKNYKNFIDILNSNYTIKNDEFHIKKGLEWLLNSQIDGYRHSFHFGYGWFDEYPETTGYIIPTMLKGYKKFKDKKYYESAKKALNWLKSIQNSDGSFYDLNNNKQVFDSGQILIGFNYVFEFHKEIEIKDNLIKTANWLKSIQNSDGSFTKFAYNNLPHTYYSRVGSAILKGGILLNDNSLIQAGKKNIEWVISNQLKNEFFKYASFDENPAYLHTIIYILEGLIEAYKLLNEKIILDSILKNSDKLLQLSKNGILCSQYDENFNCVNKEKCLTGLAQWSGVCKELYSFTKNKEYLDEYNKTITFLKAHQFLSTNKNIDGGISGSLPYNGKYMKYAIPNWAVKFFVDGLINDFK